jgi:hypothetical protein
MARSKRLKATRVSQDQYSNDSCFIP